MKKSNKIKVGIFALTALSSALTAMEANAACTTGNNATLTLHKTALATMAGGGRAGGLTLPSADSDTGQALWGGVDYGKRFIYLNAFLADNAFSYSTLNNATPSTGTGGAAVVAGTTTYNAQTLPVVCATSATPNYTTTFQTGNKVSTWNNASTGIIGLAGVLKVRSAFQNPALSLRWGKLSLENTGNTGGGNGTWVLKEYLTGNTLFKLTEVYTSLSGTTLTLKANLRFANSSTDTDGTDWGRCFKGTKTGTVCDDFYGINVAPANGANWWQYTADSVNNMTMLTGSGTYTTPTSTKSGTPAVYGSPAPTGSESQAIIGTIEVTHQY
ncbi:hypothetical protein ACQE3E_04520 [Methylomonas sp. MED-D]|uniref:hypothetical protein n=1 Tax=unclassified Methylomonas TaxID=2608980 RepID=UPI0008D9480C|nr:hypothetical protein [Methylomonas sp. LWB]OHX37973.1 hypothetical protein BJL95_06725 [Methylomonas sp. LWB]